MTIYNAPLRRYNRAPITTFKHASVVKVSAKNWEDVCLLEAALEYA